MRRIDTRPTGITTKNHVPQVGVGDMICRATMFCGDAIGDNMPPILEARAIPKIKAFDICESEGRFRNIGCKMSECKFPTAGVF